MKRLWIFFVLVMFVSFLVLGWIGTRIYEEAPPIAAKVITAVCHNILDFSRENSPLGVCGGGNG
jgi:nitric oxide reductase subunit B